ncbi:MAG TPA: hypothetical protein VFQ76_17730 [Longimicrobiaceae bacterium]|nr:hypothetical protein [Longimicrobiaceae bacterium]
MQASLRLNKLLLVAALAVCGAAFAAGGESVQASAATADVCADRYDCPGGPDKCLTLGFPDGSTLTCYKTAKPTLGGDLEEDFEPEGGGSAS